MPGVGVSGLEKKKIPCVSAFFRPTLSPAALRFMQTVKNGGTTETQHKAVRLCPVDERGTSKRVRALVMKEQSDEIKRWLEPCKHCQEEP